MRYLLILLISIPFIVMGQSPASQIREMKESVLLVRLRTSEFKIQAMKEAGMSELAKEAEAEQYEENLEIAEAFSKHFDFAPVYYFYSHCSDQIIVHQFNGCLMNSALEPVNVNESAIINFFIAEFWFVEKDETPYFSHYSFDYDTTGYKERRKNYYGGTELGPDALILRDNNFRQLKPPFPFYVRTYEGFPILRRSKAKTVQKLNENLHEYFKKVH